MSRLSDFIRLQLKATQPLLKNLDIEHCRIWQDRVGSLGAVALKEKVIFQTEERCSFPAAWAIPVGEKNCGAVLYLHGGGYTAGSLDYAKGFGGVLAETLSTEVLALGYRLAPEFPFPAALDDAVEAYRLLLETNAPEKLVVAGESAGGGLSFCLMLRIKELGLPMPAALVAISPWTDLTMRLPAVRENARRDPSLSASTLIYYAKLYAGADTEDPLVSPLYGNLEGLPPVMMFAGTSEILRDDSVVMAERLEKAGVECRLTLGDDMWHVYVLYGVPEAKEALAQIADFVREKTCVNG